MTILLSISTMNSWVEDLGEHKRGAGLVGIDGDGRVGNGRRGDGGPRRGRRIGGETVDLAIVAEIEADHLAVVIDSLSVDDVRRDTRGLVDRRESGARAAWKYETGSIPGWGSKLADDVAVIVDPKGIDGIGWRCERLQRAAIGEEEGSRAVPAYYVAGAIDPERGLAGTGV